MKPVAYMVHHAHRHGDDAIVVFRDESESLPPLQPADFLIDDPQMYELFRPDETVHVERCADTVNAIMEELAGKDPGSPALATALRAHPAPAPAQHVFDNLLAQGYPAYRLEGGLAPDPENSGDVVDLEGALAIQVGKWVYARADDPDTACAYVCAPADTIERLAWPAAS